MTPEAPGYELVLRPDSGWLDLEITSLWSYRDLLWLLVWRDFVSKYKQTVLGPLWFVIQPVMMTLVFTVIFGRLVGLSTDGLPPTLFYLCGQLGWNYFAQNFASSSTVLLTNASIFAKVYFPRLVMPLAALISNLAAFLIQALTFAAFFLYFKYVRGIGGFGVDWTVVLLPLLVLHTALLSLGVGLLVSALTAKYRDLAHATTLILQIWMYATPVIYPLAKIPVAWRWLSALNPMTVVVEAFRLMLLGTGTVAPLYVAGSVATSVVLLAAGLLVFGRVEKTFVDVI